MTVSVSSSNTSVIGVTLITLETSPDAKVTVVAIVV